MPPSESPAVHPPAGTSSGLKCTGGSGAVIWRGRGGASAHVRSSQPAPSKCSPVTITPLVTDPGRSLLSREPWPPAGAAAPSAARGSTSKQNARRSMGVRDMRAWFCSTAVRKPCGKNKPGSQNAAGCPVYSQSASTSTRRRKLATHDASGLSDGYAARCHASGTWLLQSALEAASSSALIATWPRIAHTSSVRDVESVDSSPLYRSVSCASTTPRLLSWPDGSAAKGLDVTDALSTSRRAGSWRRMSSAIATTCCSLVLPPAPAPPPAADGWIDSTVSSSSRPSRRLNAMSALACKPKTSGGSCCGSARSAASVAAWSPVRGAA
mmetsp:Transcript_28787/g.85142  ORF Transcript_28787/g.85142 Transcript_28787/m.85142 type:complete len:325 (-) Transcript_28787:303-1277(-)